MKFCPDCGAKLDDGVIYCPNCGNNLGGKKSNVDSSSKSGLDALKIIETILSKPKLIVVIVVVLLVVGLMVFGSNGGESNQEYSKDNSYQKAIGGIIFNIPDGFEESYHSGPFDDGSETVDFKSDDYDDLEISVSPKYNVDLNSKYIKAKTSKNIGGMDGILVFYDSNRVAFYFDSGDCTVRLNSNSPDYNKLFGTVLT